MVPTSESSVEVSGFAPVLFTLTSVGRERHNSATSGSKTRAVRASDGQTVDAAEPGCGNEYEPAFLVAPSTDLDRGRSPCGGTYSRLIRGRKSRMCSCPLVWSDGGPTDPAQ